MPQYQESYNVYLYVPIAATGHYQRVAAHIGHGFTTILKNSLVMKPSAAVET